MLTSYALSCGAIQRRMNDEWKVEMYREHNVYHVRLYHRNNRAGWESFDNLADARKCFRDLANEHLKGKRQ